MASLLPVGHHSGAGQRAQTFSCAWSSSRFAPLIDAAMPTGPFERASRQSASVTKYWFMPVLPVMPPQPKSAVCSPFASKLRPSARASPATLSSSWRTSRVKSSVPACCWAWQRGSWATMAASLILLSVEMSAILLLWQTKDWFLHYLLVVLSVGSFYWYFGFSFFLLIRCVLIQLQPISILWL